MKTKLYVVLLIGIGLSSCEKEKYEGGIKHDPALAGELRSSPETLTIGDNNLVLRTYLWRDFQPVAEKDGSKLMCINKLTDVDNLTIVNTIALRKQYVVNGNEIWTANYIEIRNYVDYIIEGYARGGPKWGPNIEVDVICEFENSGTIHRILAKSQPIYRTD
jgi:hypothetical protein